MNKQEKNRQQLACDQIHSNYVANDRLRNALIAQNVLRQHQKKTTAVSQMGVPLDDRSIEPLHGGAEMHVHADGLYINDIRKKLTLTNDLLLKNV